MWGKGLGMKRGCYNFFSPENKAKVAKYASEYGVTASLHHFKQTGECNYLQESTIYGWVKHYQSEFQLTACELSTRTAYIMWKETGKAFAYRQKFIASSSRIY